MPIQNWTKSKLIEWLSAHGIHFMFAFQIPRFFLGIQHPDKELKELWSIVAAYKPHVVRYVVDEMAVAHGLKFIETLYLFAKVARSSSCTSGSL
jgi:hypothetical protein